MKAVIARMTAGASPTGFAEALTGQGGQVRWQVLDDPTSRNGKVIAETSRDTADYRFPLCIYQDFNRDNVTVAIRFKPVDGEVDRAGGFIVRAVDANNYYVARANALEDNVRLYKVVDGVRSTHERVSMQLLHASSRAFDRADAQAKSALNDIPFHARMPR